MNRILIIEDDRALLETIYDLLTLEGYEVYKSNNGKQGLEKAKNVEPDLIICDIMMPGITGLQLLEELQTEEETATIPFIFLTAKSELKDIRNGMMLGADDYIMKPFNNDDLLSSIQIRLKKKQLYKNGQGAVTPKPEPDGDIRERIEKLTPREREVIQWFCKGYSCNQIAKELYLSFHTVDSHRKNIKKKLKVGNIAALVKFATDNDLC